MWNRLDRWSPLTGLVFVVLVLIGGPVLAGSTPTGKASPTSVISFYTDHQGSERASVWVIGFAFIAYLFFAGVLRSRWRTVAGTEGLSAVVLATATIEVVGQCAGLGVTFALTTGPSALGPQSAQALNLMGNSLLVISAIGNLAFGLTIGLMILRGTGVVPSWLGWVAIVMGVLFVIPPIEFIGFFVLVLWMCTMSILLLRSHKASSSAPPADQTVPAALG